MRVTPFLIGAALVLVACASVSDSGSGNQSTPLSPRDLVVQGATSQLGMGDPTPYWTDALGDAWSGPFPADWCGSFALWALHQAGLAVGIDWKVGRGFLLVPPHALPTTSTPEPGDIAYFDHNQHHAVVESVDEASGSVTLINGNGVGGVVTESTIPIGHVTAFFSIQPFIDSEAA